jgi:hypothetical protein
MRGKALAKLDSTFEATYSAIVPASSLTKRHDARDRDESP